MTAATANGPRTAPASPTRWTALTERLLEELQQCDPIYRPTTFWGPGVETLLDDLRVHGPETFKSWPSANTWFYPTYGPVFAPGMVSALFNAAFRLQPAVRRAWLSTSLLGGHQARRDFDVVRLAWDQERWPFDLTGIAESETGIPPQSYRFGPDAAGVWTRPYLNYLLCLAAVSRHVDAPPRRFLELGGGYGVLGEIVLARDAEATYVDLDLPPLLTVASFYLDRLFGDRVLLYEGLPGSGAIPAEASACLPNWRIGDLRGTFDLFFNSHSFQEMEPDVVERYAEDVARLEATWVVSLNSVAGKPVRTGDNPVGVTSPVRSADIQRMFEARGYATVATYGEPLILGPAELAILRRTRAPRRSRAAATGRVAAFPAPMPATVDLRLPQPEPTSEQLAEARRMLHGKRPLGPLRRTVRSVIRGTRALGRRPPAGSG